MRISQSATDPNNGTSRMERFNHAATKQKERQPRLTYLYMVVRGKIPLLDIIIVGRGGDGCGGGWSTRHGGHAQAQTSAIIQQGVVLSLGSERRRVVVIRRGGSAEN